MSDATARLSQGVLLYGADDLRLVTSQVRPPGRGEVTEPFGIGHECSGVVEAIGDDVTDLEIGTRVAVELGVPCRRCSLCRSGRYNLCKPFSAGGLQQLLNHPADMVHALPASVSMETGALLEPLAVAVHAANRAQIPLGARVLIVGAGPIGLACLLVAHARGAALAYMADLSRSRLDLAAKLGANFTMQVDPSLDHRELNKAMLGVLGTPVDVAFDTSGSAVAMGAAMLSIKRGGVFVPVALEPEMANLPLLDSTVRREIDIRGSFSYMSEDYKAAVAIVANGNCKDPKLMISHRYKLEHVMDAFKTSGSGGNDVVKVLIEL